MIRHKHIDKICIVAIVFMVLLTILFVFGEDLGIANHSQEVAYPEKLFDSGRVHEIDIQIDPDVWNGMIENVRREEYVKADVVINGERFSHIGIRPMGNSSRNWIEYKGHERHSLKIEFDHFVHGLHYHGLDKLVLNTSFVDTAFMKNYMALDMMREMDVVTPLASYAFVTINGEDWGLFVALEDPEDGFLRRNFGTNHGRLFKPDYMRLDDPNHDVHLFYTGPYLQNYYNIWRHARVPISPQDQFRLIESLRILTEGQDVASVVNVDEVLRYLAVLAFMVNTDSYLGNTGHNYFLYEENGVLTMIPWDFNLAFGTHIAGRTHNTVTDATTLVNFPITTPYRDEYLLQRPMFYNLMIHSEFYQLYHQHMDTFIREYFESGRFEARAREVIEMIAPYVYRDPTRFVTYEQFRNATEVFIDFNLLRAQSVRKQLNGDIQRTNEGQRIDQSNFVDASHINIFDLGDLEDLTR